MTQVWPIFHQQYPSIHLHLAGANMPDWLNAENYPGVIVTRGFVDGKKFMEGKAIMVVPSFSGSGIWIKIAEGMAKGKVILTTANGAMGIPCTHGENIFISEYPQEWVAILSRCVSDLALLQSISHNARGFAAEAFDYVKSAEKLVQFNS